ncbi:ATP-binding protein [Streptomyces sp. WMMC500]|uniref:ATP-binding protein n=1 Tax=Streptomyces sp. WMMC500 TaxID=3015154 RepID=UPI00248C0BF6|nr:ATP-binding protein [Streptomyces sp. WMMC500]WBB58886.1 ATP-binding protein [Streptomyces sp. WMMC500]
MAAPSTPSPPVTVRVFSQRFSSTPLGARLARHLTLVKLNAWGVPYTATACDAAVIVAELAANAVTHGRVPGRDFELRLSLLHRCVRIEVSDVRGERRPPAPGCLGVPAADDDSGRGLLLVDELADRWAVLNRVPIGKTVRAELDLDGGASAAGPRAWSVRPASTTAANR